MEKKQKNPALFKLREPWESEWTDMPEFSQKEIEPAKSITLHFESLHDIEKFARLVEQNITPKTRSIWFPEQERNRATSTRYVNETGIDDHPVYPVYIISKGRWKNPLTAKSLDSMGVSYKIVVEPQEAEDYSRVLGEEKVIELPFSNLGQGSIPARNWVWDHAAESGAARHWILDDNIRIFYRLNNNLKTPAADGTIFRCAEEFVDRYENVAIGGFQYGMFAARKQKWPAFYLNSRVYSCLLIKNDLPYRWRGRYNEDTDLSIRVLRDGWCTVLFVAFLAEKIATMTMAGGNTDELYADDGRIRMAESLVAQHPDVTRIVQKWGRFQHQVNYAPFKANKLVPKKSRKKGDAVNERGMVFQRLVGEEWVDDVPAQPGKSKKPGEIDAT